MKKGLKILTVSLLFSSAIFSTPAVNAVVHAEEIGETTVDDSEEISLLRAQLQDLIIFANSTISTPDTTYSEAEVASIKLTIADAQNALDNNLKNDFASLIETLKAKLGTLINPPTEPSSSVPEPSTTDSSSTAPSSTDSSSTIPSSTDSSSTAPSSTDSSSTIPSSTDSSSTIPSSTDSDVTVPTSTDLSSTDEAKPTIEITDQTMYVGQTLTEEMILSWATFHNADGYEVGFEILESPIKVTAIGNTLLEVGTYKIRYYISQLIRMATNVVAEKTITLSILSESENPLNQVTSLEKDKNPKEPANNIFSPVANPVSTKNQKSITSTQTKAKQLPVTGEVNNSMTIVSAGVILIAGAYIFRKKQLDK
ncbi:hypothetical protein BCR22_09635 [Enterococcus plantarum]|uniref:LPXTG cell wall anchor domain-containing protein n=1 Tax=Enterococcus plantarum TaxID=1077675 RepID=UPI00084D7E31|nr:LPXTG cell wall anchor domain-containing protein [Enterococcus plantarum]OEG19833.1 hypothetical protein BCR22_09635 [Enterococcus plantarum]